jgi:hypothetical protein
MSDKAKKASKINVPESMMEMLRGRFDFDANCAGKSSKTDAEILEGLSPERIVRECAAWKLGDQGWADEIAGWMKAVGAKPESF